MERRIRECHRWLIVGILLLFFCSPIDAVINETVSGYLFTAPESSDPDYNSALQGPQAWCQAKNNTLAEIYSSEIQATVVSFLRDRSQVFGNGNILLNGIRNGSSSWYWINNGNTNNLQIQEQPNESYVFGYLKLDQSGPLVYAAYATDKNGGYICEDGSNCDGGFVYNNNRCFKAYNQETLSWYEARNRCLEGGGDLASFDFINDDNPLKTLNVSWLQPPTQYWIGIRRQWWQWQNSKTEITYTNWEDGHPNPGPLCLHLVGIQDWKWADFDCSQLERFICLRNINATATTTLPTPAASSTTGISSEIRQVSTGSSTSGSTTPSKPKDNALPLGVGLGVGLGVLLIVIIIVVVVLVMKRRRRGLIGNPQSQRRLQTPDIISTYDEPEDHKYAQVQRKHNDESISAETNMDEYKTVYAQVQPTISTAG